MSNKDKTHNKVRLSSAVKNPDIEFAKDLTTGAIFGRANNNPANHNQQRQHKKSKNK